MLVEIDDFAGRRRPGLKSALSLPFRRWLGVSGPFPPWDDGAPIRAELFSVERLEEHARSLATAQAVMPDHVKGPSLTARLADNEAVLLAAYRDVIGRPFTAPRQADGLKWIVATKDVPLSLLEIARRRQTLAGFARSLRGVRIDGVLSLRDPLPGVRWTGRVARLSLRGVNATRFEW